MLGHDGPLEALKRPLRRPKRPSSCFQEAFKEIFKIAKIRQEAPGGPKRPPGSIFGCFLIYFDGFLMDFSWFVKGFFSFYCGWLFDLFFQLCWVYLSQFGQGKSVIGLNVERK